MASYDSGWVTHTHWGIPYSWRMHCATSRPSSNSVRFVGSMEERQDSSNYNTNQHYGSIDRLLGRQAFWKSNDWHDEGKVISHSFDVTLHDIPSGSGTFVTYGRMEGGNNSYVDTYHIPYGSACQPTPPTVSAGVVTPGTNYFDIYISTGSWGNTCGNNSGRNYIEANVSNTSSASALNNRRFAALSDGVSSGTVRVSNSSSQIGNLTISPNKKYYLHTWGRNSATWVDSLTYQKPIYTLPSAPTISNINVSSPNRVSFIINQSSGGGALGISSYYRYHKSGNSWSGWQSASAGSVVTLDVDSKSTYYVQAKASTSAGDSYGSEYSLSTPSITTTLNDRTLELDSSSQTYTANFKIAVTGISTSSDSYQSVIAYRKASVGGNYDSAYYTYDTPSRTLNLPNLALGTTYEGYIQTRIKGEGEGNWGNKAWWQFTTPSPVPLPPFVTLSFDELNRKSTLKVEFTNAGADSAFRAHEIEYSLDNFATTMKKDTSYEAIQTYSLEYLPPNKTLYVRARTQNSSSIWSDYIRKSFSIPRPIWGIAIFPDGRKKKIVDIRRKLEDGTLTVRDFDARTNRLTRAYRSHPVLATSGEFKFYKCGPDYGDDIKWVGDTLYANISTFGIKADPWDLPPLQLAVPVNRDPLPAGAKFSLTFGDFSHLFDISEKNLDISQRDWGERMILTHCFDGISELYDN